MVGWDRKIAFFCWPFFKACFCWLMLGTLLNVSGNKTGWMSSSLDERLLFLICSRYVSDWVTGSSSLFRRSCRFFLGGIGVDVVLSWRPKQGVTTLPHARPLWDRGKAADPTEGDGTDRGVAQKRSRRPGVKGREDDGRATRIG